MLSRLLRKLKGLFSRGAKAPEGRTQPSKKIGDVVGNVTISTQSQLDKHTAFKPGESYRVSQCIVTVHTNKESMLAAIAAVDKRRVEKEERLRARAIDIMLMSPEELAQLNVAEWLAKREERASLIHRIIGWKGKRYISPVEPQPAGKKTERFKQIMKEVKQEEKV